MSVNWKKLCKGCGKCCGPVPFGIQFYHDHTEQLQTKPERELVGAFPGKVVPITKFGDCVFLTDESQCAIYKDRPAVCRLYGTTPEMKCPKLALADALEALPDE